MVLVQKMHNLLIERFRFTLFFSRKRRSRRGQILDLATCRTIEGFLLLYTFSFAMFPFRPGSYVAFLACRIQFKQKIMKQIISLSIVSTAFDMAEMRRMNRALPYKCRRISVFCFTSPKKCGGVKQILIES